MAHILIVDDEEKMRNVLRIMLQLKGHKIDEAGDGKEALQKIKENCYDLIISDIRMPGLSGKKLLEEVKNLEHPLPVIFITAYATVDDAVEAMRAGAVDYIPKPFEEERILLTVEKALGLSRLISEKEALQKELEERTLPKDLVCVSAAMKKIIELIRRVAEQDHATVLITGESGVGKEVVARYLHRVSPRKERRFVAVNCAAIPPSLLESELFGHEKGAFTGATTRKKGIFEVANGGTVFLDEIGDLPLEAQAKLLRVLQEKRVQRLGGTEEIPVNVRIIAATNQDLQALVTKGSFRSDLYYRLNVFPIYIPPLRERKEDIIPLAEFFVKRLLKQESFPRPFITAGAQKILLSYHWPGNVRELANAVERALILADKTLPLSSEHFAFLRENSSSRTGLFLLPPEGISLEELEKDLIRQALERTGGNQSAAARLLGLTRSKFRTRMKMLKEKS